MKKTDRPPPPRSAPATGGRGASALSITLLIALLWALVMALLAFLFLRSPRWDFVAYYNGSRLVLEGRPLYGGIDAGGLYIYPPLLAQLLAPLSAMLDYDGVATAWLVVNVILLVGAVALVNRHVEEGRLRRAFWLAPLLFSPTWQSFWVGQASVVMLACLAGAWAATRDGRRGLAGALLALAAWLKIYPLLLLLYFLWRQDWRVLRGALLTGLAAALFQMLVSGPQNLAAYFTDLLPSLAAQGQNTGLFKNCSILGFSYRLFTDHVYSAPLLESPLLAALTRLALSLLVAGAAFYALAQGHRAARQHADRRFDLEFALVLVTALLLGPTLWVSGMPPLLLAYYLALRKTGESWARRSLYWLSFAVVSLYFPLLLAVQPGHKLPALVLSLGFFGILVLWGTLVHALLPAKAPPDSDHRVVDLGHL